MKKPIIGIVARPGWNSKNTSLSYVFDSVRNTVIELGGNPLLILPPKPIDYVNLNGSEIGPLNDEDKELLIPFLKQCAGIIMPGGFKSFDHDKYILEYAIENNVPILGICLGMQIMSCYKQKTELIENNQKKITHYKENGKYVHKVFLKEESLLVKILGKTELMVNSLHHYHATENPYYKTTGISEDNLIEAIEYSQNDFNIGVQWHPELMMSYDKDQKKLLQAFIDAAITYQENH